MPAAGRPGDDAAAGVARAARDARRARRSLRREAREALAIYHEHRARDFGVARTLVLDALAEPLSDGRRHDAERRLARLERKIGRRTPPGQLIAVLDEEPLGS